MMKLQRRFKDLGIGGIVAHWYDNNTRKNRLEEMKEYTKKAAKYLHDGSSVLAKIGKCNKIIGLDISKDFVEIAQRNAKEAGVLGVVEFRRGNVSDIPFPDNAFDFIICSCF